ncbi:hypothetical protein [Streptomyces griseosporeus]
MDGFVKLCSMRLTDAELSVLLDQSVLVPLALEEVVLPVGIAYSKRRQRSPDRRVLVAERLVSAVELPAVAIPAGVNFGTEPVVLPGRGRADRQGAVGNVGRGPGHSLLRGALPTREPPDIEELRQALRLQPGQIEVARPHHAA